MQNKLNGMMIAESDKVKEGIDEFPTNGEIFHEAAVRICKKVDKKWENERTTLSQIYRTALQKNPSERGCLKILCPIS